MVIIGEILFGVARMEVYLNGNLYLKTPVTSYKGDIKNIAVLARVFKGKPINIDSQGYD